LSTDGSNVMEHDLDMGGNKVINCGNPSNDSDMATKHYVDSMRTATGWDTDGNTLQTYGVLGSLNDFDVDIVRNNVSRLRLLPTSTELKSDLSMTTHKISNVVDPTNGTDVANKNYVDDKNLNYVLKTGDTITGDLTFDGTARSVNLLANNMVDSQSFTIGISPTISNISFTCFDPTHTQCTINATHYANMSGLTVITQFSVDRSIIYNPLSMSNNRISDVVDPTSVQDAATKNYVDTQNSNYVLKVGDTMTGDLTFDGTGRNVSLIATNIGDGKNFTIGNSATNNISFNNNLNINSIIIKSP
jgi:uncharacterized protein (DUF433 family)